MNQDNPPTARNAGGPPPPQVVSLDQNFLWNFAAPKNSALTKLHETLARAVQQEKVICPIHVYETIIECSMLPPELQRGIFATAEALSGSCGFHHFGTLLGFETLKLVRPEFTWPPLQQGTLLQPDGALIEMGVEYRRIKEDYAARLASAPYPPPGHNPKINVDQMEQALAESRVRFIYQLVQAIIEKGNLETGLAKWEYTDEAGQYLLSQGITSVECMHLTDAIVNRRWDAIPVLHAHTRLCACLENDFIRSNRAAQPNDAFDLSRLAVALVQADAIFCDQAMAALIDRSKIRDLQFGSKVFTMKRVDEAIAYLDGL